MIDRNAQSMRSFALILFVFFWSSVGGQTSDDPKLIDEFDPRQGCETLERQLDLLFVEASHDSQSTAYVVIHQGDNAFDNAIVHRKAISYARFRGFPIERYVVVLTNGQGDISIKLWLGKNGKAPAVVSSDLNFTLADTPSLNIIPEETLEMVRLDGRDIYIGTGNPSCLYWFAPSLIFELLKANRGFDAEFHIKTKSSKRYRQLVGTLRRQFLEDGAPMSRIKFVYGGRDKDLEGFGSKLASVTTSFVKSSRK